MNERLSTRLKNTLPDRRAAVGLLCLLAFSGCGGHRVSGSDQAIEPCGTYIYNYEYNKSILPQGSLARILATSQEDVIALQKRALTNGGSINLPDYKAVEVVADNTSLTIGFSAWAAWSAWSAHNLTGDYVTFKSTPGGNATVSPGAVVCDKSDGLHLNGTYQGLTKYAQETVDYPEK